MLEEIRLRASASGVPLQYLSKEKTREEPSLQVNSVLFAPQTGVLDSHKFMEALEYQFIQEGGIVAYGSKFESLKKNPSGGYTLVVSQYDNSKIEISCDSLINSGGLYAGLIAQQILGEKYDDRYRTHYWKGHYFKYSKKLFKSPKLVYPAPEKNLQGLGIHLTVDTGGQIKFGPDALYLGSQDDISKNILDYSFHEPEEIKKKFHGAISRYIPKIELSYLSVDYVGIRPKLSAPGEPFRDFEIVEESEKGYPGVINLIGIESPGLTSSLSLAQEVSKLLGYKE